MKCKRCKRMIEDNSIFCNWCGTRQLQEKKTEIKVPAPKQLPSGKYTIYLRAEGQSVTERTAELCVARARAIRAGFLEQKSKLPKQTLRSVVGEYIESVANILGPETIRGYDVILHNRFQNYMDRDISSIDWQTALNDEMKSGRSAKTAINSWALVAKALKAKRLPMPDVVLPANESDELPWLNYKQIKVFLDAIRGKDCEIGALLALHSLRSSELMNISLSKIKGGHIYVHGAIVRGRTGRVEKKTNKNHSSRRPVPIMVPRLQTLLNELTEQEKLPDEKLVPYTAETLRNHINTACESCGLPHVGLHGLRRSFASLCHHLGWDELETMAVGGWSDYDTVHKIYIKLDEDDLRDGAKKMKEFYEAI